MRVVISTEIESEHNESIYRAEKIAVTVKSTLRDDGHISIPYISILSESRDAKHEPEIDSFGNLLPKRERDKTRLLVRSLED